MHCERLAASAAICTAGRSKAMSAITTSNSISVEPLRYLFIMLPSTANKLTGR